MDYISFATKTLMTPEFVGVSCEETAIWVRLVAYCASQENGGVIKGAANWSDMQFAYCAAVMRSQVMQCKTLVTVEGDDVHVKHYPHSQEEKVILNRKNGKAGGRPKTPKNHMDNHMVTQPVSHMPNEEKRREEKRREEKSGEEKIVVVTTSETVTPLSKPLFETPEEQEQRRRLFIAQAEAAR